jgi:hypothetical protein
MIKAGDVFKNKENGRLFIVKSADSNIILLGTKDRTHSMFVKPGNMESEFSPVEEGEADEKTKSK